MVDKANPTILLSDKWYELGKKMVLVILPAFSSLYFGLSQVWGIPGAEKVIGTLAVLTTFLGVILGISSRNYESSGAAYDGTMVVGTSADGTKLAYSMELDGDPADLKDKKSVSFKVAPQ